jgi:O-antigen/teichoic acid export membrane protein
LGVLAGFEAFKTVASVNFYAGIASFPLLIGGVLWLGLEGAVWGLVASQALNCLLSYAAIRREARRAAVPLVFAGWWRERRLIWTFSLPAVFSAILGGPVFWACSAMIVNQPDGYGEMGVFNAANQWRTAIQFLPGMMAMAALPMLSSLQGPEDAARFRKMLKANLLLSFGAAMIAALPIALLSPLIMAAYGKGFASGAIVLVILCGAAVISATLNVIGQAIASQGRMWVGFMLNALWAAGMLGTCALWKGMGATGLALASLAAYGVHFCSVSAYVYRRLRIIQ